MIKCELCGSNIVIKENGDAVCENCGLSYSKERLREILSVSKKQDKSSVKPTEPAKKAKENKKAESQNSCFVVTAVFKIYGAKRLAVSGYIDGPDSLAFPGDAIVHSAKKGTTLKIKVSGFRKPQKKGEVHSLIAEGIDEKDLQKGDIITDSSVTNYKPRPTSSSPASSIKKEEASTPKVKKVSPTAPAPQKDTPQKSSTQKKTGFLATIRAAAEEKKSKEAEEKKNAETSLLTHLFGIKIIEVFSEEGFYNDISRHDFGGIDFSIVEDGFNIMMFTSNWKIISDKTYKFKDIKERNRDEWGADIIDKEPDSVKSNAAREVMLDSLLHDYVGKLPYLKIDYKIARATFNGKPYKSN